jgi:hypothetical protein
MQEKAADRRERERERERAAGVVWWRRESSLAAMDGGFVSCWWLCTEACTKRPWLSC